MSDERYQFQSLPVRAYRRLRYMPWSLVSFAYQMTWWIAKGFPVTEHTFPSGFVWRQTRLGMVSHFWTVAKSLCHIRMKYYYTTKEVLDAMGTKDPANA